jgi:hypothetical protein
VSRGLGKLQRQILAVMEAQPSRLDDRRWPGGPAGLSVAQIAVAVFGNASQSQRRSVRRALPRLVANGLVEHDLGSGHHERDRAGGNERLVPCQQPGECWWCENGVTVIHDVREGTYLHRCDAGRVQVAHRLPVYSRPWTSEERAAFDDHLRAAAGRIHSALS